MMTTPAILNDLAEALRVADHAVEDCERALRSAQRNTSFLRSLIRAVKAGERMCINPYCMARRMEGREMCREHHHRHAAAEAAITSPE